MLRTVAYARKNKIINRGFFFFQLSLFFWYAMSQGEKESEKVTNVGEMFVIEFVLPS